MTKPYQTPENYTDRLAMNLPDAIKRLKAFLVWRLKTDPTGKKKPGKVPHYIDGAKRYGAQGTDQDRTRLATFSDAVAAFEQGGYAGIGLAMLPDCGLVAMDLDHCYTNGKIKPELEPLVSGTYCELSPGLNGIRAFYEGHYPKNQDHRLGVEVFPAGQFVTLTGDAIRYNPIIPLPDAVKRRLDLIFQPKRQAPGADPSNDPIFQHLKAKGWVKRVRPDGKVDIHCPFEKEHTTANDDGDCTYFPPGGDYKLGNFHCLHAHCVTRKRNDFLQAIGYQDRQRALNMTSEVYQPRQGWDDRGSRQPKQDRQPSEKEPSVDDLIRAAHDDQRGCADLFIDANTGVFCYDHAADLWYRFNEHCWVMEDIGEPIRAVDSIQQFFKRAVAEVGADIVTAAHEKGTTTDTTHQTRLNSRIKSLQSHEKTLKSIVRKLSGLHFRKQVVEFAAQGAGTLGINGRQWDQQPWSLACTNGIIDLETGKLRPGRPDDYIKSPCPTKYDPQALCPRFDQFLMEIFGEDAILVQFAQCVFGMGLIGSAFQKQYLIILSGHGRNGKDTLLSIVGDVLGQHLAGPIAPEMLLDSSTRRNSSGPSPDIMRLRGLRVAWASETSQGRRFDAGRAKMLTGGGSIVGRPPYGRFEIEFEQSHLIFLLTNHRPHAPVDDYAFWKRICNIPFTQSFVDNPQAAHEHKVDKTILTKLKAEAAGILRWMVEGCLAYQRDGLNPPQSVQSANEEYRRSEDTLQDFIDEACFLHLSASCRATRLYQRYREWALDGGIKPMSQTAFGMQLTQRGFDKRNLTVGVVYDGIGIAAQGGGCHQ